MATVDGEPRPAEVSFWDRFLQEKNIKWLLAIGLLILLASSLMLVTTHWHEDAYTTFWKYLTLMAYTAAVFGAGQWSYFHAVLRKTGTVLMSLSALLVPISFFALRWVDPVASPLWTQAADVLLLALNFVFSALVARRIFGHFLCGSQPTFIASFLALSLAGAVMPGITWRGSPLTAALAVAGLWAIFAAGTVKVNRHVFWLAEDRRLPRVCGFFPILLLGGQFLLLFALNFAQRLAYEWWGLGCVLVAVPVLLTADTVARVFQERTGNIVRPLPWSIGLPLGTGLLLCVVGVCLAGSSLRPPHQVPLALVPTAMLAAALLGVAARRTGKTVLVWAALVLLTAGYNFSYVFFQQTAQYLVHEGAIAVRESQLPYAFYGLTYLPLIASLLVACRIAERRGVTLFAPPLRQYCIGLSTLLLAVSCTHVKAMFPVGLVMTGVFGVMTALFRNRRLILPVIAGWAVAALGTVPFLIHVLEIPLPPDAHLCCLAVASGLLLVPGCLVDRWYSRLPQLDAMHSGTGSDRTDDELCQLASSLFTFILTGVWTLSYSWRFGGEQAWPAALLIGPLLVVHALRWSAAELGVVAYIFGAITASSYALGQDLPLENLFTLAVLVLLGQWVSGQLMQRFPNLRVSRVFGPVVRGASLLGIVAVLGIGLRLPELSLLNATLAVFAWATLVANELRAACRANQVERVWLGEVNAAGAVGYFAWFHVITFGHGLSMFAVLGVGILFWSLSLVAARYPSLKVLSVPFEQTGLALPLVTVAIGVGRYFLVGVPQWLGMNSLALLLAAGVYCWQAIEQRSKEWWILSGAILNVALFLLWRELAYSDPQFYMVPIGMSVLALVQLLKREIPADLHDPLRYLGALVILVSPTFHIVGGSWLHLVTLMIAAVAIALVAIGLQVRALLYTGIAFLAADLVAMVIRGSIDHPNLLWIAGLALGAAVFALAAACENNREKLLQRLRVVSATLQQWE